MATVEHETVDSAADEIPAGEHVERNDRALAIRPPATTQVLMPMDVEQVVQGMAAYQSLLPRLLAKSDYQDAGGGKRFVKKSGWRKIARAFNLSLERVSETVERDDTGAVVRAAAVYRAVAPNGQYGDGDGYCDVGEPRFEKASSRKKLENDLRATATTRAKNRAISDLVGMGEVSAEEIAAGSATDSPEFGPVVPDSRRRAAFDALLQLVGTDAEIAEPATRPLIDATGELAKAITDAAGYLPAIVVSALALAARARADHRGAVQPEVEAVDADVIAVEPAPAPAAQRSYPQGKPVGPVTPPAVVKALAALADQQTLAEVKGAFVFAKVPFPEGAQGDDRFAGLTEPQYAELLKQLEPVPF